MPYKKCPRCNLNYIKDFENLCMVCIEDLGSTTRSLSEDDDLDICPECGENVIKVGEDICVQCLTEHSKEIIEEPIKKDDDWEALPVVLEADESFSVDLEEQSRVSNLSLEEDDDVKIDSEKVLD